MSPASVEALLSSWTETSAAHLECSARPSTVLLTRLADLFSSIFVLVSFALKGGGVRLELQESNAAAGQ